MSWKCKQVISDYLIESILTKLILPKRRRMLRNDLSDRSLIKTEKKMRKMKADNQFTKTNQRLHVGDRRRNDSTFTSSI